MAKQKAVILSSGGLNSTVVTAMAQQEHAPAMLHVRFGHRAGDKEHALFLRQIENFSPQHHLVVDMPHFIAMGGNARVSRKYNMEDARAMHDGRSNSHIPGLIGTLICAAYTWANVIGANKIMLGVSEDLGPPSPRTGSIFPDYTREHIELIKHALLSASGQKPITIETPIIDLNRADIIKLGGRLGVPFDLTWSCLSSGDTPCGACIGCATRARGFVDAGVADPILTREPAMAGK